MIWLAWRQHRIECLLIGIILTLLAIFLLITGLDMIHTSQRLGLTDCLIQARDRSRCASLEDLFMNQFGLLSSIVGGTINFLPILLGLLVGTPLVARELEQGTHRLIWTQSITRFRWLNVKLALVLSVGLLASAILLALLLWWNSPFTQFNGLFRPASFDIAGPVWLAATLLALALGIFAGTLTRRTVLAMLFTIILLVAIRLPVEIWLRPTYEPALTTTWPIDHKWPIAPSKPNPDEDWIIARGWIDAKGNRNSINNLNCPSAAQTLQECLKASGARSNYLTYQPADRFWTFQWIETGIYLTFTILTLGVTVWLVRRRLN